MRVLVNTESVDDYLKAILELSGAEEERVASNTLARQLGVRAASVTGMVKKLAAQRPSLVKYEKHHGVRLTRAGRIRALEVLRHHRLLERFLHDCLEYTWDEVHEEAERLEHFISERLEDRIAAKLSDPQTDPHGHLIPERSGTVPDREEVRLSKWACAVPAVISSVSDRDASRLREMERLGLRPGVPIVVEAGVRNASLLVRVDGRAGAVRLSQELAGEISVIPVGDLPVGFSRLHRLTDSRGRLPARRARGRAKLLRSRAAASVRRFDGAPRRGHIEGGSKYAGG